MEISKSNLYYLYLILILLLNKLTDGLEDEQVNDDDDDETYDEDPVDLFVEPVKTGDDLANFQHTLLANYDPDTRPVINSQDPIKVFMRATIVQINNLDEIYQVMTSTLQLNISWRDEFLVWNESVYPNAIAFDPSQVWTPDIIVTNNLNSFKYDTHEETYMEVIPYGNNIFDFSERDKYSVLVRPNGECQWSYPMKLLSVCQLNLDFFPFDVQECYFDFRSSAYVNKLLVLRKYDTGYDFKLINEAEFDLQSAQVTNLNHSNVYNAQLDSPISIVRVTLHMKRKITFYFSKIVLPYFIFYFVTIFTYSLPVESGEKKSYSTSILISAMIYLKDISPFIPKTSVLPLLTIYFDLNLILVFICIAVSTMIYLLYYFELFKIQLPLVWRKFVAKFQSQSKNKCLVDEMYYVNIGNMRNDLNKINSQLERVEKNLKKSTATKQQNNYNPPSSDLRAAKSSKHGDDELLAGNVLSLLVALKTFIKEHQNRPDQDMVNLNLTKQLDKLDREKLRTFHSINKLENLKLNIISRTPSSNTARKSHEKTKADKFSSNSHLDSTSMFAFSLKSCASASCSRIYAATQHSSRPSVKTSSRLLDSSDVSFHSKSKNQTILNVSSDYDLANPKHTGRHKHKSKNHHSLDEADEPARSRHKHRKYYGEKAINYLSLLKAYKQQIQNYVNQYGTTSSPTTTRQQPTPELEHEQHESSFQDPHEWKHLAIIIDKIIFAFFSFFTPFCLIIMYIRFFL